MKKLFILLFMITILPAGINSYGNVSKLKTQIIVIGTVHYPTINFTSDTLLNILVKLKPDLILIESDSSYLTKDFHLKDDIKYEFLETSAITEFLKYNKASLRPYDINERDKYLDNNERRKNEESFFSDVDYLSRKKSLPGEVSDLFIKISSMINVSKEMSNSTAYFINSDEAIGDIDSINYYTYSGFSKLIELVPELEKYKSYWDSETGFWKMRNRIMLENILKYKNEFEGATIAVLSGFSHKNILTKGLLEKKDEENIDVTGYREFLN